MAAPPPPTYLSNPAQFMFLNPGLAATGRALTVEDAAALWVTDPTTHALPYRLPALPAHFSTRVFMAENHGTANVSALNGVIRDAMANEGVDMTSALREARYIGSILQPATLTGSNTFRFTDNTFRTSPSNLNVGDQVQINQNSNQRNLYGVVAGVTSDGFSIDTPTGTVYTDTTAEYTVYGIRCYDPDRLALVNLAAMTQTSNDYSVPDLQKTFDLQLYQVLYPDSRLMTLPEAYQDYVERYASGEYRITNASDFSHSATAPVNSYTNIDVGSSVTVANEIVVGGGVFDMNAQTATATFNGAVVCATLSAGASNLTVNNQGVHVARHFSVGSNATGSDFTVADGFATTSVPATFTSTVSVTCNVSVHASLAVDRDVEAYRFLAWSAIGIGGGGVSTDEIGGGVVGGGSGSGSGGSGSGGSGGGSGGSGGSGGGSGGSGGTYVLPDPLSVHVLDALTVLNVGSGGWSFAQSDTDAGSLIVTHPSLGSLRHAFDTSGRVGLGVGGGGVGGGGGAPGMPLQYGLVVDSDLFTTGAVISQSDARHKTDLERIGDAVERVRRLTGYTYATSAAGERRCTGLLAQDVHAVLPEAVHTDATGLLSVAYGNLAGLFVEAIKQLGDEMRQLRARMPQV